MSRKLDILVPYYNEGKEVIKPLLDTMAVQRTRGFKWDEVGCIIVRDTTEDNDKRLDAQFLSSYPFKIEYYEIDHKGVSAARQYALDKSTAEYVSFCDCDDCFYSVTAFWILFREINGPKFNALISKFLEESCPGRIPRDDDKPLRTPDGKVLGPDDFLYMDHGDLDTTFVHGKMYRRQFLIDAGIEWNPKLKIHEDSYFNIQCQKLSPKEYIKFCPYPFYLWCWREDSVCRHDKKYILKTFKNMLATFSCLIDTFLKKGHKKEAIEFTCFAIYDTYFTMNKKEWLDQENKEYRDDCEKRFYKLYSLAKYLFDEADEQTKNMTIGGIKTRMMQEGLFLESVTFEQWIQSLKDRFEGKLNEVDLLDVTK